MRNLWSNSREQTQGNEKRKGEDSSYPKGIEALLRETARKGYPDPEEVNNPMISVRAENNSELIPQARKIEFESCK